MKTGYNDNINFFFWNVFKEQTLLEKHQILDKEGEAVLIQGQYL